mmetsp:Transcript_11019/g.23623  ORF Transcript_11019/g.23623 Transcript_11019/m.23623 type:complete len:500 (-) Transcript_11019:186-1685(-)
MEAFLEMSMSRDDSLRTQLASWEHGTSCAPIAIAGNGAASQHEGVHPTSVMGQGSEDVQVHITNDQHAPAAATANACGGEEVFGFFHDELPPPDALFENPEHGCGRSGGSPDRGEIQIARHGESRSEPDEMEMDDGDTISDMEVHGANTEINMKQPGVHSCFMDGTTVGAEEDEDDDAFSDIFSSTSSLHYAVPVENNSINSVSSLDPAMPLVAAAAVSAAAPSATYMAASATKSHAQHRVKAVAAAATSPISSRGLAKTKSHGPVSAGTKRSAAESAAAGTSVGAAPAAKKRGSLAGTTTSARRPMGPQVTVIANTSAVRSTAAANHLQPPGRKEKKRASAALLPEGAEQALALHGTVVDSNDQLARKEDHGAAGLQHEEENAMSALGDGESTSSAVATDLVGLGNSNASASGKQHRCNKEGCGKVFSRKHNLKVHMRKHTGEMPYACPHAGCTKSFKWKSSMKYHDRLHAKEIAAATAAAAAAAGSSPDQTSMAAVL